MDYTGHRYNSWGGPYVTAVGAPVFSSFRGGFYMLVGKTGGYLWGFLPMAVAALLAVKLRPQLERYFVPAKKRAYK